MRPSTRVLPPVLAVLAILALATVPALAKEGAEAKLDTAIPRDAEPGSTIDVGWSVLYDVDGKQEPVYGSPVYIRLVSTDRATSTEVMGTETPAGSGHYTASIEVPGPGIGEVIVGMVGEACDANGCQRSDLIFPLTDDALVTGAAPVTAPAGSAVAAGTPVGDLLVPIVAIGVAFAIAGALAATILSHRRTLEADTTGR